MAENEEQPLVRPAVTSAASLERRFRAPDGVEWGVREVAPGQYDRRGGFSLIFTSEETMVMRRVREYPANWATLSEEELYALSLRR